MKELAEGILGYHTQSNRLHPKIRRTHQRGNPDSL
jgi:hypothetical protein